METFSLQTDKTIRYQPLPNEEEERPEKDNSAKRSIRSSWSRFSDRRIYCYLLGALLTGVLTLLGIIYIKVKSSSSAKDDISLGTRGNFIPREDMSILSAEVEDSLLENWETYADKFFTVDGLGARVVYSSPNSVLNCEEPGVITILINSTYEQNWKDFSADKSCSEIRIVERLEISGTFSFEDLYHIFKEIPNVASLKLSTLSLILDKTPFKEVFKEKVEFSMLTSLSVINAIGDDGRPVFDWMDYMAEMPFLSEILIMKSDIIVPPVNNILKKSADLKSIFLIGNNVVCDDFLCPEFTKETANLIELVLINGNPTQNDYWANFIDSMLLRVKDDKSLRILETNIPTNITVLEILINSEFRLDNRQVYEIAFRLPAISTSATNAFAERQLVSFEQNYEGGTCSKVTLDDNNFLSRADDHQWINLCQDSQHNIMYGFCKAKFIQHSHLTIFIRRAQRGNVICYNSLSSNKNNEDEEFSCQNIF